MFNKKRVTGIWTAAITVSVMAVSWTFAAQKDVMEILPSDCQGCVRINNLQATLTQIDQYLAGSSPLSLSMMATMQLGKMFGDPMMTGIDMQGNFAFAAVDATPGQNEEKETIFFFLVPSTDIPAFLKSNSNLSAPDTDGIYVLQTPESQGNSRLTILPLTDQNYLLVCYGLDKSGLLTARKILNAKKASLKSSLPADTCKAAAENPVWVYLDAGKLYQCYNKEMADGFSDLQKEIADKAMQKSEPVSPQLLTKCFDIMDYFASQTGWITLSLNPTPQQLQIDTVFSAKTGSELAGMLKPQTTALDWKYAGALNDEAASKILMRINKPLWEKLNSRIIEMLCNGTTEADKALLEKMKQLISKSSLAMGDEIAASFSYRAGTPPFEVKEIVAVKDAAGLLALQKDSAQIANDIYRLMGMPIMLTYTPSIEKYNGTDISQYQFHFLIKDPNDQTLKTLETFYGKNGLQYPVAITPDRFLMAMGPNATTQVKAMIDAKQSGAVTGDMKVALALLPDNTKADMVISMNILKLIKGLSGVGQAVIAQTNSEFPDFWKDIKTDTTSCMVAAAYVENGRVRSRTILPKEHLTETFQALMQVQQKQMMYYMQQQALKPGADANTDPDQ